MNAHIHQHFCCHAMPHQKMKTFQKVIKYLFQFSERTRFMSVLHPSQFSFWIQAHDKKIVFPKKGKERERGMKCWGKVLKIPYQNKISQGRISSHKYGEKKAKTRNWKRYESFSVASSFIKQKKEKMKRDEIRNIAVVHVNFTPLQTAFASSSCASWEKKREHWMQKWKLTGSEYNRMHPTLLKFNPAPWY